MGQIYITCNYVSLSNFRGIKLILKDRYLWSLLGSITKFSTPEGFKTFNKSDKKYLCKRRAI